MATIKITKRTVDSLTPQDKPYAVYDSELKGFGIRVQPSGVASYIVEYRPDGGGRAVAKKRMAIGRVGELTPDKAREIAKDRLSEVRQGVDPLSDRQTKRREMKVSGLIDLWEEIRPTGKRTGRPMAERTRSYTLARLRHHVVPILGSKRVSEVTVDDVNDLIRRVTAGETKLDGESAKKRGRIRVRGGEGAARKVASDLSIIYGFAIEKRIVAINPVTAARKPKAGKRFDFLRTEEIKELGQALSDMEQEGANGAGITILRLLLITGARPAEIEGLRWEELDLKARCIRVRNSKTGYSVRPLPPSAISILKKQSRVNDSPYVFPATRGDGHFLGSKKLWNEARRRAKLPEKVRYHARHTVASLALSEGHDVASVAAIMGHANPRTTLTVYAHVLDKKATQAADQVGAKIRDALNGGSRRRKKAALKKTSPTS
ncbi:site-specific recombinase XerD [Dongia mobilis]|uniref:Site-specific recombinase XerD n=1 Tax=Dongia mobilis TaxID=578943 RepID=A0A4R6WPC9_9PROT|nr:tyrosine-type recombinase/integrase [Dongia mobilis]TDQ83071.1 site-specific recombinase XerD [Dongia mobilis]